MSKNTIRSARGTMVDFDMLRMKQTIETAPKTVNVATRERFVDHRSNRRLKRMQQETATAASTVETPVTQTEAETVEEQPTDKKKTVAQKSTTRSKTALKKDDTDEAAKE